MPETRSTAQVRDRFVTQGIDKLQESMDSFYQGLTLQQQLKQPQIDLNGWEGDLTDLEGIAKAFDREENASDVIEAIKEAVNPGSTGDLSASFFQADWLACQERAFRYAHASPVRLLLHAAGRHRGHGHKAGVLKSMILSYVETLLKLTKNKPPGV